MNHRKICAALFVAIFIALGLTLNSCKNNENSFTVIGDIKGMPESTVRLLELGADDQITILDSAKSNDEGHFELSADVQEPGLYQLSLDQNKIVLLSIEKGNVKVSGDWNNLENPNIEGSAATSSLKTFIDKISASMNDYNTLSLVMDSLHAQGRDSLMPKAQSDLQLVKVGLTQYIENYADTTKYLPNALFAVRILNPASETVYLDNFVQSLGRRFPNAKDVKVFTDRYNQMTASRNGTTQPAGGPGEAAPEISMPTPDGKTVNLSSLRGKYVLIDFWASWCGPCRAENPNVVAAYNKFKDKNFTIYGVSLDDDKDDWEKAIAKDGLTWTHVSDLERWENAAARDYQVQSIPANFLVDPQGKIIARNLRGPALEAKLAEVLQ